MKKAKESQVKVSFGKRREGKHRKSRRPKEGRQKPYKGQGR